MSVAPSSRPSRSLAHQTVAESWQKRRSTINVNKASQSPPPSLCFIFKSAWTEFLDRQLLHKKANKPNKPRSSFPSVSQILEKHAIHQLVSNHRDIELPQSDALGTAVSEVAAKRSRVFWLVDLSHIVRQAVAWHQQHPALQFVYTAAAAPIPLDDHLERVLSAAHLRMAGEATAPVVDASQGNQCNSYLRDWWRRYPEIPVAVSDMDEIYRLARCKQRLEARDDASYGTLRLEWVLTTNTPQVTSLVSALRECAAELVGLRIDVSAWVTEETTIRTRVQALLEQWKAHQIHIERCDLTGVTVPFAESLVAYWNELPGQVAVDVTQPLLESSTALCTRIIGVRQIDDARHYYIDDGCYGSLCPATAPLPLRTADGPTRSSTVWGPTCDGLDRVCDLELPCLQRDDWLVFRGPRANEQRTGFNGFDPPDTAYCVLGYFGS